MRRITAPPRPTWRRDVEELGFTYHTIDGDLYWDEAGWYEFTLAEIETIEAATNTLHELCLQAVQVVLDQDRFDEFGIPPQFRDWIRASWDNDEPTVYGRFDLAWDGRSAPKLLEYNADTPTALFEAAVVQWQWLESRHPGLDQFNSLHEELIAAWKYLRERGLSHLSFAATAGHEEDFGNITYLRDTAAQAGVVTDYLDVSDIGYDSRRRLFVGLDRAPIDALFKLYPWEWMLEEEFAPHLLQSNTQWIEPPWKMLLSSKAMLVVLWELFPECEYLLPASWEPLSGDYVRKPMLSREGSNVQIVRGGFVEHETEGPYDDQPEVYQAYHPLLNLGQGHAVLGSWIVGDTACGLGIREDANPITHNTSRFVPHLIRG
jgi:glutathionylspermidine synthase